MLRLLLKNSSTFRERVNAHWLIKSFLAGLAVLCMAHAVCAIDANRLISQYLREHLGTDKGFPGGSVTAIAQTTDGYLWIGTDRGLIRFDGTNFRAFPQASPATFPIGAVQGLVADAQGNLWIVLQTTKILRYHDGQFEIGRDEVEFGVTSAGRKNDGSVLLSSLAFGPMGYRLGKYEILASSSESENSAEIAKTENADNLSSRLSWATGVATHRFAQPNSAVTSLAEAQDRKIWLGTQDQGLFYLKDGRIVPVAGPIVGKINCLLPVENGEVWVGTPGGMLRWSGSELTRAGVPAVLAHLQILALLRDADGNTWVATSRGLFRMSARRNAPVELAGLPPGTAVTALFEDRERNLWVGDSRGVERFRSGAFVTYTEAEGLPSESNGPVYVGADARTWFAPLDGGLHWLKAGQTGSITEAGLNKDVVYSIAGSGDELWLGRQQGGLTHLRYSDQGVLSAQTFTEKDGLAQNSVYVVKRTNDGTIWAGTLSAGVSKLENGHFTSYTSADGLPSNTVSSIERTSDGTMWFATPKGLSAESGARWKLYRAADGLPSEVVNCLYADPGNVLWIGTSAGIAFFTSGRLQSLREMPSPLNEQIFGIAPDEQGGLWVATLNHVVRISRAKMLSGAVSPADIQEFGADDGLTGNEAVKRQQSVFADPSGRIWFSMNRGLSMVDPVRATKISAPVLVHVDGVSADGNPIAPADVIKIPAGRQRITFRFIGLSLAAPERVGYRYSLESFDQGWSDPVITREAVYTNLRPGSYRFRVIACNSDGVWNQDGPSIALEIIPAFYQTRWFLLLAMVAVAALAWASYQTHVRQVTARLDMQYKERLSERTRIARELHDTLLQSFQGLMLHFQRVRNLLPAHPEEAMQRLDTALEGAEQAIVEGRNAIQDIRSSALLDDDLAHAIDSFGEELNATEDAHPAKLRVVVEGEERILDPVLRDEVYRIAREALRNAYKHSGATRIEAEITYDEKFFRLRIRDDGRGINPAVVNQGERAGHWGLPGMRERATRLGGQLAVWSELGAGTEVELSVPGSIAYRVSSTPTAASARKKNAEEHD
jgi:ligand-binding sensor domain-containing protein/signal transduction histidine kinase